jgi:NADH-quinone oxidoreductase subunit J
LFTLFAGCVLASRLLDLTAPAEAPATVRQIGEALMTRYVLALQVVGLLLTAALMGAVLLAAKAKEAE